MGLKTFKQFAEECHISYEAVRKQTTRYKAELSGHIIRDNRTQYLDDWAVSFLKERRRANPVVMMTMDQGEDIEQLTEANETLRTHIMNLQDELLQAKEKIIELQAAAQETIEERAKQAALLTDFQKLQADRETDQATIADLRASQEKDRETIEALTEERDRATAEAQSFTRSIFGFYRKR